MTVTLPPHLTAQLSAGKVILVLGAGASHTSLNRNKQAIIGTTQLAEMLSGECGLPYRDEPLPEVFEAASTILGEARIKDLLLSQYSDCRPSEELGELFQYTWRRVYTFNIDDSIRSIPRRRRVQSLEFINA